MVVKPVPYGSGGAGILPAGSKSGTGEGSRQDGGAPGKEGN
jgi:hypothetical protein